MNLNGKIAVITNVRDKKSKINDAISRGLIISNYLNSDEHPEKYLQYLKK